MVKTLKAKISLVYLSLVVMIAIVGTASVINLYKLSKAIDGLMTANYKSISAVGYMLEALIRQDSAMLIYMSMDRQKGIDLFSQNSNTFIKWYNVDADNITETGEKELIDTINNSYAEYMKLFSQLQEIRNNQGYEESTDFYNTTIVPGFNKLKQSLKDLSVLNEDAMFNSKNRATQNARQSALIILIISSAAIGVGFVASGFSANRFLKPIYSLTETIKLVKAGNLNRRTDIVSHDEIGELALEFNNMTKRLQQYEQSALGEIMAEKDKSLAIVKSISDPLIALDADYRIILLNNAFEKIFNISEESALNRHFLETVKNEELFEYISEVLKSGADYKEKIVFINTGGSDYYFNVMVTVIRTGLIVVLQNITQLKQLEILKTDFIATISHEFKTPLTSIMMGTGLMLDESMGVLNEEQKDVLNTMMEDGERLSTLVNDLLELTKIESGKTIFNIEPCSVTGIIEVSVKQFYKQAGQKDVSLYYDADDDLPEVNADFEKITWVLNNLISNALKYTNAGDEICVRSYVNHGKMCISVKDTGAGIPEEYLGKIFDKFIQVRGYDLEVRGTGLGLAVAKEIVEAHGGEIWCESRLDEGSAFIFTLDLTDSIGGK